jgi:hypothetical protein
MSPEPARSVKISAPPSLPAARCRDSDAAASGTSVLAKPQTDMINTSQHNLRRASESPGIVPY